MGNIVCVFEKQHIKIADLKRVSDIWKSHKMMSFLEVRTKKAPKILQHDCIEKPGACDVCRMFINMWPAGTNQTEEAA